MAEALSCSLVKVRSELPGAESSMSSRRGYSKFQESGMSCVHLLCMMNVDLVFLGLTILQVDVVYNTIRLLRSWISRWSLSIM